MGGDDENGCGGAVLHFGSNDVAVAMGVDSESRANFFARTNRRGFGRTPEDSSRQ